MQDTTQTLGPPEEHRAGRETYTANAYAARGATSGLAPASIQRRTPRPPDVQIEILYCGVCHSDLHQIRDQWHAFMPTVYPRRSGQEKPREDAFEKLFVWLGNLPRRRLV